MKVASLFVAFFSLLIVGAQAQTAPANIIVKDGQKVVFMGDSITGVGWSSSGGYVQLVVQGLTALNVNITPVPAGVGGDQSRGMLARLNKDVLTVKPDWLFLSCGVNDVWGRQITLDEFKKNITSIVDQTLAAGIKIVILTPTPIYEASTNEFNDKLPGYVAFMVEIAKQHNLPLADENAAYKAYFTEHGITDNNTNLTVDGVHPNPDGHQVLATTVLQALGVTPDQMTVVTKAWHDAPENASVVCNFGFHTETKVSQADHDALQKIADTAKIPLTRLIYSSFLETVRDLLVAQSDLSKVWSDDFTTKAAPLLKQKLEDVIKQNGTPDTTSETVSVPCDLGFRVDTHVSLNEYDALKKVAVARKITVSRLVYTTYLETIRDLLVAQGDLSKIWSDDISFKSTPVLHQKIEDLLKQDGTATPAN